MGSTKEQSKPQLRPIVNNEGNVGPDRKFS